MEAYVENDANMIVVCRVSHSACPPKVDQRENLFHTQCKVGNNTCNMIPAAPLPNKPDYGYDPKASKELQRQIEDLMEKSDVREGIIPFAVPNLLIPNKDETWTMCYHYRAVNYITTKYLFPMPRMEEMVDELHGASQFSKYDLWKGYHEMRIREGDEWKTVFKAKQGLYEWMVMAFVLYNVHSLFIRLMNKVFETYGDSSYKIYFPSDPRSVSAKFNMGDLTPYLDDANLRANSFEEGENDVNPKGNTWVSNLTWKTSIDRFLGEKEKKS